MASATTLLSQNPTNAVDNPQSRLVYRQDLSSNISIYPDEEGIVHANFDGAFLPLCADEAKRMNEIGNPPNERQWRLETEADIEHFWHTEVSDIVLALWARYPGDSQKKLARELRGYADKYGCPQVFCWDGRIFLMLQFRTRKAGKIRDADCPVDCWVIPMDSSSCTLRYALYRLMVQGLRRCQAMAAGVLVVGGLTEHSREFYTGKPIWSVAGTSYVHHPGGYYHVVDEDTGALRWLHEQDSEGIWETGPFW